MFSSCSYPIMILLILRFTWYKYGSQLWFLYKLCTMLFSILHLTVSIESLQYTNTSWLFSCFSSSSMLRKYEKQNDVPFVSIAYIKYISIMTLSTMKSFLSYLYVFTFVNMCCCIPDKFHQTIQLKNRKKIIRLYFIKNI